MVVAYQVIESKAPIEAHDRSNNTPLLLCAMRADSDSLSYLLTQRANVEHCNHHGNGALLKLATIVPRSSHDSSKIANACSLLLQHNSPLDTVNNHGDTCLIKAARQGSSSMVSMLIPAMLDKRVSLETCNNAGIAPIDC
jgi:ankyrin repeat protein